MPPQFQNNNVPSANLENHHRDPSILITLIVVMLLSGAGAVWYISNLPPEPTPQPITKVDQSPDTTNWKTYRNEEYGFEIRLPIDWKKEDMGDEIWFTHPNLYRIFVKKHPPFEINFSPINARIDVEEIMLLEFEKIRSTFKFISTSTPLSTSTSTPAQ